MDDRQDLIEDVPITQIITDDFILKFEKQATLYQDKYLPICFRLTNEADWISHTEGKFFLQSSGAEKICNPLGIQWERPIVIKHEREDDHGKFYEYEVEGIFESKVLRRSIWVTGNCSSRDQFFVARGAYDEGDIRKSAYSNWIVNGVSRIAGIRNPTPAMLAKAGLNPEKIQRINYRGDKTPEQAAGMISDPQRKRLWAICKNKNVSEAALKTHLERNYKITTSTNIPRDKYDEICKWAEAGGPPTETDDREPGSDDV